MSRIIRIIKNIVPLKTRSEGDFRQSDRWTP
jgi:hypothetical protein